MERFNIVSNDHGRMQKYDFCFCLKSEMLCILWFSPSSFFRGLLRNIGEFGAKIYFTDHLKPNKILGVRDSVLACKIPESSLGYAKIPSNIAFLPIQAMQAITTVQWVDWLDEYIKLQKAFKRI